MPEPVPLPATSSGVSHLLRKRSGLRCTRVPRTAAGRAKNDATSGASQALFVLVDSDVSGPDWPPFVPVRELYTGATKGAKIGWKSLEEWPGFIPTVGC